MSSEPGVPQNGTEVLGGAEISRALTRISFEILERNHGAQNLVILGIPTRGVPLAARIAERIAKAENLNTADLLGTLDITMYRDDLASRPPRPIGHTTLPPAGITGKTVVLIDDVLFSGRTIRAALDALNDLGRPSTVQLAVLVDRGHRQLPIRADFVGKNLPTSQSEQVKVRLEEIDGADSVFIYDDGAAL